MYYYTTMKMNKLQLHTKINEFFKFNAEVKTQNTKNSHAKVHFCPWPSKAELHCFGIYLMSLPLKILCPDTSTISPRMCILALLTWLCHGTHLSQLKSRQDACHIQSEAPRGIESSLCLFYFSSGSQKNFSTWILEWRNMWNKSQTKPESSWMQEIRFFL